ncbi:hypothetical protein STXM2123_5099 [Streptomyces sp. F-3]|nr:hypothetical protein STXM2123_5099 [Streptomyces sp. F-3]
MGRGRRGASHETPSRQVNNGEGDHRSRSRCRSVKPAPAAGAQPRGRWGDCSLVITAGKPTTPWEPRSYPVDHTMQGIQQNGYCSSEPLSHEPLLFRHRPSGV